MPDDQRHAALLSPAPLAVLLGTGTILAATISYLLSAAYGRVPWCIPFWESCSSISAAARKPPSFFVFKAIILPLAGLMLLYWPLLEIWLCRLENRSQRVVSVLSFLGGTATLALILYTTMLGAVGDLYQLQRRIGIILFFGFTALAHLIMLRRLWMLDASRRPPWTRVQLMLSVLLLTGGVANSMLKIAMGEGFDRLENSIEWCFAVVMVSQFIFTGLAWRDSEFRLSIAPQDSRMKAP